MDLTGLLDKDQQLEAAMDAVANIQPDFEDACRKFADAESEYRVQFAKEFLNASGAVEERKQKAIQAVERFLRERDKTEAIKEFTKEKLRNAQAAVSARQSLLSADVRTNKAFA
jgi:hypothetical protein